MTVAPHVFLGLNALGQWMLDCSSEQDKSTSYALFKEIEDFEYEIIGSICKLPTHAKKRWDGL